MMRMFENNVNNKDPIYYPRWKHQNFLNVPIKAPAEATYQELCNNERRRSCEKESN